MSCILYLNHLVKAKTFCYKIHSAHDPKSLGTICFFQLDCWMRFEFFYLKCAAK